MFILPVHMLLVLELVFLLLVHTDHDLTDRLYSIMDLVDFSDRL